MDKTVSFPFGRMFANSYTPTSIGPVKTITFWNFLGTICFDVDIAMLTCIVSMLLVVDRRFRHPTYLMNLLLGLSVTRLSTTVTERILFLCLAVALIARYISMFYAKLFKFALVNRKIEINDLNYLANYNLSIMVKNHLYSKVLNTSFIPTTVKEKMFPVDLLAIMQTVIQAMSLLNLTYIRQGGLRSHIICKAQHDESADLLINYFAFQYLLQAVQNRSPYKEELNGWWLRVMSSAYVD